MALLTGSDRQNRQFGKSATVRTQRTSLQFKEINPLRAGGGRPPRPSARTIISQLLAGNDSAYEITDGPFPLVGDILPDSAEQWYLVRWDLLTGDSVTQLNQFSLTNSFTTGTAGARTFRLVANEISPPELDPSSFFDDVIITINNSISLVSAGDDQIILTAGNTVFLNALVIGDQGNHTYEWEQTSGDAVTLSNANITNPTFTMPSTDAPLQFTFFIDRGEEYEQSDTVEVFPYIEDEEYPGGDLLQPLAQTTIGLQGAAVDSVTFELDPSGEVESYSVNPYDYINNNYYFYTYGYDFFVRVEGNEDATASPGLITQQTIFELDSSDLSLLRTSRFPETPLTPTSTGQAFTGPPTAIDSGGDAYSRYQVQTVYNIYGDSQVYLSQVFINTTSLPADSPNNIYEGVTFIGGAEPDSDPADFGALLTQPANSITRYSTGTLIPEADSGIPQSNLLQPLQFSTTRFSNTVTDAGFDSGIPESSILDPNTTVLNRFTTVVVG